MELTNASYSKFNPDLSITELPGFIFVKQHDGAAPPILKRHRMGFRCRTYPSGAGILTCFPFPTKELPSGLGSTNPRLTMHCRGTLAHKADGILTHLCYYYWQDFQYRTVQWSLRTNFYPCDTPLYHTHFIEMWSGVSAADLDPSIFPASNLDR